MSTGNNGHSKASQLDLGIKREDLGHIVQSLSVALASTYMLYIKTQGFHWNVTGPDFYSLHKLSEGQYEDLSDAIDTIAERIRALVYPAPASLSWFEKLSIVGPEPEQHDFKSRIRDLMADHEAISKFLKDGFAMAENAHDHGTGDLFVERMRAHEKAAWMLRATLAE